MKIAIIGAGNMGAAIARGLSRGSIFETKNISVSDINEDRLELLTRFNPEITTLTSNVDNVKDADIVLLAVKPWLVEKVIGEIKAFLNYEKQIIISIAAGVPCERLNFLLAKENDTFPALFRVIPNTAIGVLQSVYTIASSNANREQKELIMNIFNELGKSYLVPENQLNAFMALSSCGIAYAFRYIRAATEGAVEMGISPYIAKEVKMQTLRGAIELLETNDSHPEAEVDRVTTPGGIAIKGLNKMEACGFTNSVIEGLKASWIKD